MINDTPSLVELQRWMRWIFTNPQGPYKALSRAPSEDVRPDPAILYDGLVEDLSFPNGGVSCGRFQEPLPRLFGMIHEPGSDPLQRLSIYADAYFARLLESLASDFKTLHDVLGSQHFQRLAADYLLAHPSSSPQIGDLGQALPRFLENHPLTTSYPYITDLARLEWNVLRSLYSERLPAMDASILSSVPEPAWSRAKIVLDPTVRLLGTEWAVDLLWEDRFLPGPAGRKTLLRKRRRWLVLYRDDRWVQVRSVDGQQWFVLERFQEGATLERVCRDLAELFPEAEELPVQRWFGEWVRLGILKGVHLSSEE